MRAAFRGSIPTLDRGACQQLKSACVENLNVLGMSTMNLTPQQWCAVLDDADVSDPTIVKVLRGEPVAPQTARRLTKAAERAGCLRQLGKIAVTESTRGDDGNEP